MTTFTIGVVGFITRNQMAKSLAATVKADVLNIDDGTLKCGGNHRDVWGQLADFDTEWAVCLEDDAVPVDGFLDQLDQVLTVAPEPIVGLYLGRQRPKQFMSQIQAATEKAEANDACWISSTRVYQAVGVAIHTGLVHDMVRFATRKAFFQIDDAIGYWAIRNQYRVAHTWPSIVDHRDVPSVEHRKRLPGRTAWKFGSRDEWTSEAVTL